MRRCRRAVIRSPSWISMGARTGTSSTAVPGATSAGNNAIVRARWWSPSTSRCEVGVRRGFSSSSWASPVPETMKSKPQEPAQPEPADQPPGGFRYDRIVDHPDHGGVAFRAARPGGPALGWPTGPRRSPSTDQTAHQRQQAGNGVQQPGNKVREHRFPTLTSRSSVEPRLPAGFTRYCRFRESVVEGDAVHVRRRSAHAAGRPDRPRQRPSREVCLEQHDDHPLLGTTDTGWRGGDAVWRSVGQIRAPGARL